MRALSMWQFLWLIGIGTAGFATDETSRAVAGSEIQAFLKSYCFNCHGKDAEPGR